MATPFPLNDAQRQAVEHENGPALVIAGAGSGKTRVLTSRVERLLERGVAPEEILAFTFTNRAAKEMRERIERTVGATASRLWIGTFHATAVKLLRRECKTLGLPAGFSIYDREDQEGVLRDILKDLGLGERGYKLGVVLGKISECKNALVTPGEAERAAMAPFDRDVAKCFGLYQAALRRAGALDFDDLIGESVRLFLQHPEAGARWSRRFRYLLVDEYQDTNHAQFRLVQALAAVHGNLFVVGDDDQSIYGWRGADLANVLEFERAFPGAITIRLEQNYRSTNNILKAANAVIAHNQARKGKTLWSTREDGALVSFALCGDESEEARRVRRHLESKLAQRAQALGLRRVVPHECPVARAGDGVAPRRGAVRDRGRGVVLPAAGDQGPARPPAAAREPGRHDVVLPHLEHTATRARTRGRSPGRCPDELRLSGAAGGVAAGGARRAAQGAGAERCRSAAGVV